MKVLVLNSGSSSVKYKVFSCEGEEPVDIAHGVVERIGGEHANINADCCHGSVPACVTGLVGDTPNALNIPDHGTAIKAICEIVLSKEYGVFESLDELGGIGHRVVHGGEYFSNSILIDEAVIKGIDDCKKFAPLHNPPALAGIRACAEIFPGKPQIAVFDTAFHATLPPVAFRYPVPKEYYHEHGIRKYGFHGTSHRYVSRKAMKMLDKPGEHTKILSCHLGNGCSISAIRGGKCVETSMGMTPLGGVIMGTRSGNMDPYVTMYMIKELGMSVDEVDRTLNKESGLLGICDHNDLRDIEKGALAGETTCKLALDMFAYTIARFIGSYTMVLNGCDAIVFTAGIGENSAVMRRRILANAGYLGVCVDEERNTRNESIISTDASTCKAFVIPTNEEFVIARDTAVIAAVAARKA